MSLIACPNCRYQQEGGDQCARCNSLFAYYDDQPIPTDTRNPAAVLQQTNLGGGTKARDVVRNPRAFDKARKYYRFAQWVTLGLAVLVVGLILKKGTPPPVSTDPLAAVRAEEKIRDSQVAKSLGEPHKLQLDSTELNSYLNANLATAGNIAAQAAAVPGRPGPGWLRAASSVTRPARFLTRCGCGPARRRPSTTRSPAGSATSPTWSRSEASDQGC